MYVCIKIVGLSCELCYGSFLNGKVLSGMFDERHLHIGGSIRLDGLYMTNTPLNHGL